MPRWVKLSLKVFGGILGLFLLVWIGLAVYINLYKKELLKDLTEQLNENLNGKITIASMEPALIQGFPGVSVSLNEVLLRDTLYAQHQRDLLKAQHVYAAVNVISLLRRNPQINNISIRNGRIYLYTDSLGRTNADIIRKNANKPGSAGSKRNRFNKVSFQNVDFIYENQVKRKLYKFHFDKLQSKIKYRTESWTANVDIDTKVGSLSFNTVKGSFIKNKSLKTSLEMRYDHGLHILTIPVQDVQIDKNVLQIGGDFAFAADNSAFNLRVVANQILYKEATSLLTPNIAAKLNRYNLDKPLDITAEISGKLKEKGDPKVLANWKTSNNTIHFMGTLIKKATFSGKYTNAVDPKKDLNDGNSVIQFDKLTGTWNTIAFQANRVKVYNLKNPVLEGTFKSNFPAVKLNNIVGNNLFRINQGNASLNLVYRGALDENSAVVPFINGKIAVSNVGLSYSPRKLDFKQVYGTINFKGNDLYLENMQVKTGSSSLYMQGSLKNFLNLYYTDPTKIQLDWHIQSPNINLNEFLVFLGRRNTAPQPSSGSVSRFNRRMDQMLRQASVHMNLNVKRVQYKKFLASNLLADVTLRESGLLLNNATVSHAGGKLTVTGSVDQSGKVNQIAMKSTISNVNIQELFHAFDNFGQTGITDQNIRGKFSSITNVKAQIRDNGDIVPRSFTGTVDFDLKNAALINFAPMQKIGNFAFPNRNFANITFNNLKNTLLIQGNRIVINPMRIESSVLNVFVQGIYSMTNGTNIQLEVPLRNPKKDAFITDQETKDKRARRGIVLFLNAKDDENGNVRIKLGKSKEDDLR